MPQTQHAVEDHARRLRESSDPHTAKIRELNDKYRQAWGVYPNAKVVLTHGIASLSNECVSWIAEKVQTFGAFAADNDPHGEHDFGQIDTRGAPPRFARELQGEAIFWKFDYYDLAMQCHSPDAADPKVTVRVLTIMLASEY